MTESGKKPLAGFCFDCDDTLYDCSEPFRRCMETYFPEMNFPESEVQEIYASYRHYGDELFERQMQGEITAQESGILRTMKTFGGWNLPVYPAKAALFQVDYLNYQQQIHVDEPLWEFLKNTKAGLAVLTNGEDSHQRMKCSALHLSEVIPEGRIVTSGELGLSKPQTECFRKAFEKIGDDPENWYYVGDNYINDIEGAKSAGMKTIHFNRHHRKEGPAADYVVYTAKELADLLSKIEAESEKSGMEKGSEMKNTN